jgi:hypothetical protein
MGQMTRLKKMTKSKIESSYAPANLVVLFVKTSVQIFHLEHLWGPNLLVLMINSIRNA